MDAEKVTPEQCARQVVETVPSVMRFIRTQVRKTGAFTSMAQFRALNFINRKPGSSLSDLADHLGVTRPITSAIVDRLVQHGLIERVEHPQERRRVALTLTEQGARLLAETRKAATAGVQDALAGLPEDQLRRLANGMTVLANILREISD